MEKVAQRVGVGCGVVAPLGFLCLYMVAIAGDPGYTFFTNYLSDLGVGPAAWAFNSAVILAGSLTVPFALLAVWPRLGGGIAAGIAVALTIVGGVFLVLIGVFTEDSGDTHYIVSVGFFLSMETALLFYSWTLHFSHALGREVTGLTQAAFGLGAVLIALGFNPQTETVAVLSLVVWGLVVAVRSDLALRTPPAIK